MATPASAFDTYEAIGNREELHDEISDITPWETPVMSAIGSESCDSTHPEWQTDSLAAASTSNFQIEGEDVSISTRTPTTRVGNRTQISRKSFQVTGTQEVVNKAGRGSELDYQALKVGRELLLDNESSLIGLYQAQVVGSTAAARKLGNFSSWIKTNTAGGDTAPASGDGTVTPTVVANSVFTETMLQTVMQSAWQNGGNPDKLFVPASIQTLIANTFVGRATEVNDDANRSSVSAMVDVYRTNFGTIQVIPCRNIKSNMALLLDTSKAAVLWLRPTFKEQLPKNGDSTAFYLLNEFSLKVHNEKAHGAFYGIAAA